MKIKIDIDCTPQEVRDFLGLPNVAPMQERLLREVEERLKGAVSSFEGADLWKTWMPMAAPFLGKGGAEGLEQMRRFFWAAAGGQDDSKDRPGDKDPSDKD